MNVTVKIDISKWETARQRYVEELGLDAASVVEERARSLVKRLIDLTPPTRGKMVNAATKGPSANKVGRSAIERDFRKAVTPLGTDTKTMKMLTGGPEGGKASSGAQQLFGGSFKADNKRAKLISRLKEVIKNKDITALRAIFQNLGRWGNVDIVAFNPSLHTSVRDANGRVKSFQNKVTLDVQSWQSYQKELLTRLGYAKAGYLRAAELLGVKGIPKWVTRHGVRGGEVDNQLKNHTHPTFRIINNSIKIPNASYLNILNTALEHEVNAMTREVDFLVKKLSSKHGFKTH